MVPASTRLLDTAFQLVTALSRATVSGADGATLTLERRAGLTTVAATDDTVDRIDRAQYETRQGPCFAATTRGRQFHVPSLAHEPRWPKFVPRAMEAGFASIVSTPLILRAESAGALNVYSRRAQAFRTADLQIAHQLASHAAALLAEAEDDLLTDEGDCLQDALRAREVIAQSQGVLMERYGTSADESYAALRDSARLSETTLRQQADDVLASTHRFFAPSD